MKKITLNVLNIFPILSLIILILLQWHNINSYPITRGFDATGHIEYINYLKNYKRVPLPYEGWELWQPPFYYFSAALFPDIKSVRIFSFINWLILIIVSIIFLKKVLKNQLFAFMGGLLIGSLAVIVYQTPVISNELFSAVIISCALIYYLLNLNLKKTKEKIILGILLGLSCLTKATGLVLIFCIIIDQLIKNKYQFYKFVKKMFLPVFLVFIISGWFYIRNIILFKNPFMSSFDFPKYAFSQSPGFRDLRFFIDLSGFWKLDLFRAHHYSLWAGTFFSWFYDGHNVIIPVQKFSKAGAVLVIFSLPLLIFSIVGFVNEIKKITEKNRLLIIYPIFLFAAYILYNFRLPFYSTVKGVFLTSLVIPWVYFTLKGILYLNKLIDFKNFMDFCLPREVRRTKWGLYRLITLYIFFYSLLIFKNFWILPAWYK